MVGVVRMMWWRMFPHADDYYFYSDDKIDWIPPPVAVRGCVVQDDAADDGYDSSRTTRLVVVVVLMIIVVLVELHVRHRETINFVSHVPILVYSDSSWLYPHWWLYHSQSSHHSYCSY